MIPIALVAIAMAATGCSKKNGSGTTNTEEPGTTEPAAVTVNAVENDDDTFAFEFDTDFETGGVQEITLNNTGDDPHDFQLAAAVEGHTLDEIVEEIADPNAPFSDWVVPAGGVGQIAPGGSGAVFQNLPEGEYWYFCTQSTDVEGQPSIYHAANGMAGEFTVTGDNGAEVPEASATVAASEYTFDTSGLVAGTNAVEFVNEGEFPHHAIIAPMAPGATAEDIGTFFGSEGAPEGPPPVDFEAAVGTAVVNPGDSLVTEFEFEAGTSYAFVCFMPDPGTAGPPHVAKGMLVTEDIA